MSVKTTVVSAALVVAGLGVAHATVVTTTLDLGSLPTGTFSAPAAVGGFVLTPKGGSSSLPTIVDNSGTFVLASSNNAGGDDTYLTMNGGGTFTLVSVQIGLLSGGSGSGMAVSSTSYTDNLNGVATATPRTISFGSDFVAVASVDLDAAGTAPYYTAITVSYTPVAEPSALVVFGPALLGIGLAAAGRRKRLAGFGPPAGRSFRWAPSPG